MSTSKNDSFALTAAGIAEGTNANTFKTTYAVSACIDGRGVYKAATDNIAFAAFTGTSLTALIAKQTSCFFHMMKASDSSVSQIQSTVVASSAGATYTPGAWEWPFRAGYACIGATVIRTDNAATFTAGSTDLGASDVVDTHYDAVLGVYGTPIAF